MSTKVTTPVEGFTGTVAGVQFTDGKGETDSESALAYFRRHGYGVGTSEAKDPAGNPDPADNLADLTVAQLRKYAKDKGIDLGDAEKKADILAAVERAVSPPNVDDTDYEAATATEEANPVHPD